MWRLTIIVFLKLGGSLITNKQAEQKVARTSVIARLAHEIAVALDQKPDLNLVLGHGSGSFGHIPAKKFGTRRGVSSADEWKGFSEVWWAARALNQIVIDIFHDQGLPVIAFPPSSSITTCNGCITQWNLQPLISALQHRLIPVVYGDVVFDQNMGGTIVSTEDLFIHLASEFKPTRLLLAGQISGVYQDYPVCKFLIPEITPSNYPQLSFSIGDSSATDVTGGMAEKVKLVVDLVKNNPNLEGIIYSGEEDQLTTRLLTGANAGTLIHG